MRCITNEIQLESIPLKVKTYNDISNIFDFNTCGISVLYLLYDKKSRSIITSGSSRPNGHNNQSKISIHAEEMAIKECIRRKGKSKNYDIYIWKWGKDGRIRKCNCCQSCTKLANKFGKNIYTFDGGNIDSAILDNPKQSLGNIIRNSKKNI
jgi:hypothetical protein